MLEETEAALLARVRELFRGNPAAWADPLPAHGLTRMCTVSFWPCIGISGMDGLWWGHYASGS
ncbi:hypothetical protein AB2F98_01600 [Escherichia coli]